MKERINLCSEQKKRFGDSDQEVRTSRRRGFWVEAPVLQLTLQNLPFYILTAFVSLSVSSGTRKHLRLVNFYNLGSFRIFFLHDKKFKNTQRSKSSVSAVKKPQNYS